MHYYETITFKPMLDYVTMPKLEMHVIDCPQCHMKFPVPAEYTDWKHVAERREAAYKHMVEGFKAIIKEAGEQFDVPLAEYMEANRQTWIAEMEAILHQLKNTPPK